MFRHFNVGLGFGLCTIQRLSITLPCHDLVEPSFWLAAELSTVVKSSLCLSHLEYSDFDAFELV